MGGIPGIFVEIAKLEINLGYAMFSSSPIYSSTHLLITRVYNLDLEFAL